MQVPGKKPLRRLLGKHRHYDVLPPGKISVQKHSCRNAQDLRARGVFEHSTTNSCACSQYQFLVYIRFWLMAPIVEAKP
jgi:hypothetical protein